MRRGRCGFKLVSSRTRRKRKSSKRAAKNAAAEDTDSEETSQSRTELPAAKDHVLVVDEPSAAAAPLGLEGGHSDIDGSVLSS